MTPAKLAGEVLGWADNAVEELDELEILLADLDMNVGPAEEREKIVKARDRASSIRHYLAHLRAEARAVPDDEEPAATRQ